ncbi:phenazine biosynthesis protein PhzF family [Terriglobus roseus DSM 18391]|uniref:Phenazine biosynthesis protein PhzF family n=1 Tax=Terriglobus roseus (strain DSM 18391 / NRRL B-41598 / KBS 63) TaxID=926566 RepID=I3ZBD4_TERRK|nr:PhzF family phenazine biosynthesis protein [Terriglobus roseus]AFL86552.1 phenazine biosynthesis protein PhzF family [Terriglobus roseus DSM 18391]
MSTWFTAGRSLDWVQVDVFAERAYEGNMLAIFTDGRSLSDEQMQSLARETNLSETTFILPATPEEEREHGVRVRIFTVEEELPFAGHPTLGTASWLWANHPLLRGGDEVRLKLNVGTIAVRFRTPAEDEAGVYGEMRQRDPEFGPAPDRNELAAACGLAVSDLHTALYPQVVSTGLPFCIVPLASLDALQRMRVDSARMATALAGTAAKFIYAITPHDGAWRARMPFHGADDPATGSAAGCAISYLVRHNAVPSQAAITIHQGIEVHRPSRIDVRASLRDGAVTDVFVGGRTIPVASGTFTHP